MKKTLFSGYYGHHNLGDDAFGLIAIWGAKRFWKQDLIRLFSSRGPKSKEIKVEYALSRKGRFRAVSLLLSYLEIVKSNYFVFAGGSIFHSKPRRLSHVRFVFLLARFGLLKVGAIGVSLGPFRTEDDYNYIALKLKHLSFLTLRDKKSFNIALGMNLPYPPVLAADLAFSLPAFYVNTKKTSSQDIVGISLCHYERYCGDNIKSEERRERKLFDTLKILKKNKGLFFKFFVINGSDDTGDRQLTIDVIDRLFLDSGQYELIEYSSDTLSVFDEISSCSVFLSTRLHGAIFSAIADVPSLLVEYHKKCTDYLDDMGVEKKWRIGDIEEPPEDVALLLIRLITVDSYSLYPNKKSLIDASLENFSNKTVLAEMS